jgi:hypothetical protein
MANTAKPWDGSSYPANDLDDIWAHVYTDGVIKGILDSLKLINTTSPITVKAGAAKINGKHVLISADVDVTIPAAVSNPRVDRIVIRINYGAKSVTIERLEGAEDPNPIPLEPTTSDGITWEYSLGQVRVTPGSATLVVTPEATASKRRGEYMKGDLMRKKCSLSGHFPMDPDLGSADRDWHLCNGDVENGFTTPNSANRVLMSAGGTYAAGSTGGAATINIEHTHAPGTLVTTGAQGQHRHGVSITSGKNAMASPPLFEVSLGGGPYEIWAHSHLVQGDSGYAGGHDHTTFGGATAAAGSATQSILPPYEAEYEFCFVGNISG